MRGGNPAVDTRRAFFRKHVIQVLEEGGYGHDGEYVGLDVKTFRTQKQPNDAAHLANSKRFFELMLHKVRSFDRRKEAEFIGKRDYEGLERMVIEHLLGR